MPSAFYLKLTDCDGENSETNTWLDFAIDCGYIDFKTHDLLVKEIDEIGVMLGTMIKTLEGFILK